MDHDTGFDLMAFRGRGRGRGGFNGQRLAKQVSFELFPVSEILWFVNVIFFTRIMIQYMFLDG